jgi:hypothetical protein
MATLLARLSVEFRDPVIIEPFEHWRWGRCLRMRVGEGRYLEEKAIAGDDVGTVELLASNFRAARARHAAARR